MIGVGSRGVKAREGDNLTLLKTDHYTGAFATVLGQATVLPARAVVRHTELGSLTRPAVRFRQGAQGGQDAEVFVAVDGAGARREPWRDGRWVRPSSNDPGEDGAEGRSHGLPAAGLSRRG